MLCHLNDDQGFLESGTSKSLDYIFSLDEQNVI